MNTNLIENAQDYYGKELKSSADLKTSACCSLEAPPAYVKEALVLLHEETLSKFYGCGSPIPPLLDGLSILDLGSGSGRDCYVMSKLAGPSGSVLGVDVTDEQLEVAERHIGYHMEQFGFSEPNVAFRKGCIEDLKSLGLEDGSIDLVTSNCVLNLSADKEAVFAEIFRVLKRGGELYFSDVFADRRIEPELRAHPVLHGECLGGALYIDDFRRMLQRLGIHDYRVVSKRRLSLDDPEIDALVGHVRFYSMTIRVFNMQLEDRCEDYGQVAYYRGTVPHMPHVFELDDHHAFYANKPMLVCSNTARMLQQSRYAEHFRVEGDESRHFGLFDCASEGSSDESEPRVACC